jgi:acyl carrier protein
LRTDVLEVLQTEIATVAKVQNISADTSITRDLGLDSLVIMNFVMTLEDRFDMSIPIDRIVDVDTVGDLANVIESLQRQRTPS